MNDEISRPIPVRHTDCSLVLSWNTKIVCQTDAENENDENYDDEKLIDPNSVEKCIFNAHDHSFDLNPLSRVSGNLIIKIIIFYK